MDRIVHADIEQFKERVHATNFHGRTIGTWNRLLSRGEEAQIRRELADRFNIRNDGDDVVA